jgi:hypothetical protein
MPGSSLDRSWIDTYEGGGKKYPAISREARTPKTLDLPTLDISTALHTTNY